MGSIKNYFLTLDLFSKNDDPNETNDYQRQTNAFATRFYLVSLIVTLIGIGLAVGLRVHTHQNAIDKPTQIQFESLIDPICPCLKTSLSYGTFISHNPSYHQVCSSDFTSNEWIKAIYFGINSTNYIATDFRATGSAMFQALASFCELCRDKVAESISLFNSTSMISSRALSESDLTSQVEAIINQFQQTAPNLFRTQVQLISQIIQANQMYNGLDTCLILSIRHIDGRFDKSTDVVAFLHEDGSWCACVVSTSCQEPAGIYNEYNINTFGVISYEYEPVCNVPGIVIGLAPVDTLLQSSLQCLFNVTCLEKLLSYSNIRNQSFNIMIPMINSRFNSTSTVQSMIDELMVESWGSKVSFEDYYAQCAPLSCSYIINEKNNISDVFTTLIGLLGGLCTVLATISIYVLHFFRRQRNTVIIRRITVRERLQQLKQTIKNTIIELNLFVEQSDNQHLVVRQRIATRIFIIILITTIIILVSYTSLSNEIQQVTIKNPTRSQYENARLMYSSSLQCPCSSISIKNNILLQIKPEYHPVCTSDFVSADWIDYSNQGLIGNQHFCIGDYRAFGGIFFQLLQTFCQQSEQIVTDALEVFLQVDFVTAQAISSDLFTSQTSAAIREWQSETIKSFNRTFQMIQAIYAADSLVNSYDGFFVDPNVTSKISTYPRIYVDAQTNSTCDCSVINSCPKLLSFYNTTEYNGICDLLDELPSLYMDCSPIQGVLESTLECFYNKTCMELIYFYSPLENQSFTLLNSSRSDMHERIDSLVGRLFVETWSTNTSYDNYYQACLPEICTYQYSGHRDVFLVLVTVISIFGGLNTVLKIIFTILLRIIEIFRLNNNNRAHFRTLRRWIFSCNNKKYLKNRLNVLFLCITLVILFTFSSLKSEIKTMQIQEPSLNEYKDLLKNYPDSLRSTCSKYSIQYDVFLNVSVSRYHQVCSSEFISDSWIQAEYSQIQSNQLNQNDFQFIFAAFSKILRSMCQLIKEAINDSILQLTSSELVNSQVLSLAAFDDQINSIINQFQINTADEFYNTLYLIRRMTGDNTLMSARETNWRWRDLPNYIGENYTTIRTEPIQYGSCDCGLSSRCTQPAMNSQNQSLRGLYVGCYSFEALLKSSLECFYDYTCFQNSLLKNISVEPLDPSLPTRFNQNATVEFIIRQLMVEEWLISTSYENYFDECHPASCSYSYEQYYATVDAVTNLIGLYGSLVILTKVFVHFLMKLLKWNQPQPNRVEPVPSE